MQKSTLIKPPPKSPCGGFRGRVRTFAITSRVKRFCHRGNEFNRQGFIVEKKRILIADDEEQMRFSLSLILSRKGYEVTSVVNGKEALAAITAMRKDGNPLDLLICDIRMPNLDGEGLIQKLRLANILIPTLVITGYGEKDLVVRLMRLGCRDFIDKPFEAKELEKRVDLILMQDDNDSIEKKKTESLAKVGDRARQIVHDLNNVLSGTMGYADLAIDRLDPNHPSHTYVSKIMKSASRASDICQGIISATTSTFAPTLNVAEMNNLVMLVGEVLRDTTSSNITIEIKVPSTPFWCSVDVKRIQQALLNLGMNAADAMDGAGHLVIENDLVEYQGKQALRMTVSDNGCGIREELKQKIFEKGFSTKVKGSGMGLLIVKEIVLEHNGEITVDSKEGYGTTFTILIPSCIMEMAV